MRLYYKGKGYTCTWKTQMSGDWWYSMEPAKLKLTLPKNDYLKILSNIKSSSKDNEYGDIFQFDIHKKDTENTKWGLSESSIGGLWKVESWLERSTITSSFKNGTVSVVFSISVKESEEKGKGELRDLILNDLFKSEKQK